MSQAILVVDDEPAVLEIASAYLRLDGFVVRTATTGRMALDAAATQPPDLVVLDLVLPDMAGENVCSLLRRRSAVPILLLTAKGMEEDRLRGFSVGADDYLVKPFSPRELVARARAILRRTADAAGPSADLLMLGGGRLEIDLRAHEARVAGARVPLTVAEFRVLAALAGQPRRAFTREELARVHRGGEDGGSVRTVNIHVMRIRAKMDAVAPGSSSVLATVYGVGYRFDEAG